MTRSKKYAVVSAILLGALFTVPTTTAVAAPTPAAPQKAVLLASVPMYVGGFNAAVAKAHGYSTTPRAHTLSNPSIGNCGQSWVYGYPQGNSTIEVDTGFSVGDGVVDYSWNVTLKDRGGTINSPFTGRLSFINHTWEGTKRITGLTKGAASATVKTGSFAQLANGNICYSGSPSTTYTIT